MAIWVSYPYTTSVDAEGGGRAESACCAGELLLLLLSVIRCVLGPGPAGACARRVSIGTAGGRALAPVRPEARPP